MKQWSRSPQSSNIDKDDLEALLMTLIAIDVALVRHGRVDLARSLRREVARLIGE